MDSLVYYSEADPSFEESGITELVKRAQVKNRTLCITGFLYFDPYLRCFVQFLEGAKGDISDLIEVIGADERHHVRQLLWFERHNLRLFQGWSMRQISAEQIRTAGFESLLQQTLQLLRGEMLDEETARKRALLLISKMADSRQSFELAR